MNIIFSLCGKGQRFADVGFTIPKYLIAYNGAPMLYHSVETLGLIGKIHFIVKKSHLHENKTLERFLLSLGSEIIAIDGDTRGAAESILFAEDFIQDKSLPLISANGDQFMDWDSELFERQIKSDTNTSYIVTFKSKSEGCSYAKTNENGLVTEVREKKLISDDATVGIYHWAKSEYFFNDAKKMMEEGIKDNNEYYVAPVYNNTLQHSDVKLYQLQKGEFSPIGTPDEYYTFTAKNKFFT